jgi:methyl coenzyme M reductase subunit C
LIVLGGDNFQGRVREAARINVLCEPPHVLVSDAPWFAARLEQAGIPQARIMVDAKSRTTRQQMQIVDGYVRGKAPRSYCRRSRR